MVSGEHAIQDLIDICGDNPSGSMCKKNTIRYKYNPKIDTINIGGEKYYVNAIHKSDLNDARDDVKIYYKYLEDKENTRKKRIYEKSK